jgi:hypothetical protein
MTGRWTAGTRKDYPMMTTRFQSVTRLLLGAVALGAIAMGIATVPAADAAGLRNCVDVSGKLVGRVGCYELVWADGQQVRMTFSNQSFDGAAPKALDAFYVLAPQSDAPQGAPPKTFAHDHVVRDVPEGNHGTYSVQLQGFFVMCSGQGIVSGACVPAWTSVGGPDLLPLATTVHGRPLTSAEAIEAAATAGDLVLQNLGPSAVIVGSISGR